MPSVPTEITWTTGQLVTAAQLNANLRDALNFFLTPPLFIGRHTVTQNIAITAWTGLNFDVEDVDTAGGHSTVTNISRYIGQYPGYYQIDTNVDWAANTGGIRAVAWRTNGGTTFGKVQLQATNPFDMSHHTGGKVFLNGTTDYVETIVWQNAVNPLSTARTDGDPRTQIQWSSN